MTNTLKIAAFTALTLVAAGSIAEAAPQQQGKHSAANRGTSVQRQSFVHPVKHQGSSGSVKPHGMPTSSGSGKVVITHCDPGPCKGSNKPPVITHCDPGPCKGNHPGKDPIKVVEHHKPHHWHHHHHHRHDSYSSDYRYGSGYYQSAPSYRPQPTYATYAPTPAAPVPASSCLAKEYLANGPVLFKDTCTKEWAMGEAAASHFVNVGCLRKEYVDGGKVKFTDVCTKEWAMNPPAGQQTTAASTESDDDED